MIDLKAVRVSGAVNIAKARVLWKDGTMKVFGKQGMIMVTKATEPQRAKGWLRSWIVDTDRGTLKLSAKCQCGWRDVARIPANELWGG